MNTPRHSLEIRKILRDAWRIQLPKIIPTFVLCLFIALAAISAVYIISVYKNVPPSWLTRDPNELVPGKHSWVGALSKLGYMGWASAVAVCFMGAALLIRNRQYRQTMLFLLFSGLLSLMLALDDTFMLHESVFPQFHISEKIVFIAYIFIAGAYAWYFFRRILDTDYILLGLAVLFILTSIAIDEFFPKTETKEFVEDLPKFMGILLWLAYYASTAFSLVKFSIVAEKSAELEVIQP